MPDPILMMKAAVASAALAAVIGLLCGWPWRTSRPALASAGCVLGAGLGLALGCWLLDVRPHWPPREDQDRLFFLVLPAVVVIEALGTFLRKTPVIWALRLALAASAGRVLLHGSTLITDTAGPGTREWTVFQAWCILGALAILLAAVWVFLAFLVRRPASLNSRQTPARAISIILAIALACGGAGVTIMLSGYATGGQLGIPLTGALVGAAVGAIALRGRADLQGVLGLGVVGLFGLLLVGRFFGNLTTAHAIALFVAPLLCWMTELPYVCRMRAWLLARHELF